MDQPRTLVGALVARLQPLETESNQAWWEAAVTGEAGAYEKLEALRNRKDQLFREPDWFEGLVEARRSPPDDPVLARSIELLYLEALPRQVDPDLSERLNRIATRIDRRFSTYRPLFRGERRTPNDLEEVLKKSSDQEARREAWEALKSVGPELASDLAELVGLRNEAARSVGFPDFWHMKLGLLEQDPAGLDSFLERIRELTDEPFRSLKAEIDERLGERFGVPSGEIGPWHFQDPFFQEAPDVFGANLDEIYSGTDVLDAARRFFDGIGFEVEPILGRSSLYEAEGKNPHAFATDIDREGDVRVFLNLRQNERWMGTTLHELGHAVYDDGIARDLPWPLRRPAHTLTTEAIAMFFGRLSRDPAWMRDMGLIDSAAAERLAKPAARELAATMLVFSRWVQVMARFERGLYADPEQDLNDFWWSLVERFQGIRRPPRPDGAADYAAKIHVVSAPVYYHNYLMGECFASQIDGCLHDDVLDGRGYAGSADLGRWLTERIFEPGARIHYDALAHASTGSPVGPEAFAAQFLPAVA